MKKSGIGQKKIPVVIMAGGLGTRAQTIDPTIPKPLLPIGSKPILQWEIECLVSQGYTDIILTISYMAEKIEEYFGNGEKFGCSITYYNETTPLGNAGALFKMLLPGQLLSEESGIHDFLLLNADSMFDIDFDRFVKKHLESGALATLFTHPNNHPYDSGLLITDSSGWVEQWLTKEDKRPEYYKNCTNAGLHCLSASLLLSLVENGIVDPNIIGTEDTSTGKIVKVDLDRQVLKPLAGKSRDGHGSMLAVSSPEYVKDMGTPARFEQVSHDLISGLVAARNLKNPQKAIFLDRDGTINRYVGFLRDIDQFELLPGVAEAIRLINSSGYLAIVVTNQPVIARGEVSYEKLQLIHNKMETLLGAEGAYLDAIYFCPHHPCKGYEGEIEALKFECECRKPKPGMLLKAAEDFNIDLSQSWVIGDGENDIKAGKAAGCKAALIGDEDFGQDIAGHSLFEMVGNILTQ